VPKHLGRGHSTPFALGSFFQAFQPVNNLRIIEVCKNIGKHGGGLCLKKILPGQSAV
jgi:hypothetical protein